MHLNVLDLMLNFNTRGSYQQKLFWGRTVHQGRGACLLFHTASGEREGHLHQTAWWEDLKRCLCRPFTPHVSLSEIDFGVFQLSLTNQTVLELTTRFRMINSSSSDL